MPRFRDENDFPDVEALEPTVASSLTPVVRRSPSDDESGRRPVNDRPIERSPREELDALREEAYAVPSPKPKGLDSDESVDNDFVEIERPDDARREINRSSNRWPSTLWGASARLETKNAWKPNFVAPEYVIPCIERKVRREVLFAKRRAGGGGARRRPRRRSYWSNFGC